MKIIKLVKNVSRFRIDYDAVFDEIPEMTYEKIGSDYVGSVIDSNGEIIMSEHLTYASGSWCHAFAGREIKLKMKDGTIQKIKNNWYNHGFYKKHGECIDIGAGTLEKLQRCYVYFGMNINKKIFSKMVEEYLSREKVYTHKEVESWCKLQYKWYNVIVNGKQIPYMMNKYGDMVEKESKKMVFPRYNMSVKVNGKYKNYIYFRFKYKDDNDKLIKIEANYLETLKATLPFTEEEIKENCKLKTNM